MFFLSEQTAFIEHSNNIIWYFSIWVFIFVSKTLSSCTLVRSSVFLLVKHFQQSPQRDTKFYSLCLIMFFCPLIWLSLTPKLRVLFVDCFRANIFTILKLYVLENIRWLQISFHCFFNISEWLVITLLSKIEFTPNANDVECFNSSSCGKYQSSIIKNWTVNIFPRMFPTWYHLNSEGQLLSYDFFLYIWCFLHCPILCWCIHL